MITYTDRHMPRFQNKIWINSTHIKTLYPSWTLTQTCTLKCIQSYQWWVSITYLQLLCMDTGCSLEDLPEVMKDRDEWWEREPKKSMLTVQHDDDDDYFIKRWPKIIKILSDFLSPSIHILYPGQNQPQTSVLQFYFLSVYLIKCIKIKILTFIDAGFCHIWFGCHQFFYHLLKPIFEIYEYIAWYDHRNFCYFNLLVSSKNKAFNVWTSVLIYTSKI